jgi:hypothetical protein
MTSELFLLGFFSPRFAAEPFSMRTDLEGELIADDATYTSIKSGLGVVMGTWLKNVYGRGHLDNSHASQVDRLRNCSEFILYSLLSVFVLSLTIRIALLRVVLQEHSQFLYTRLVTSMGEKAIPKTMHSVVCGLSGIRCIMTYFNFYLIIECSPH